jgi:hypothetical protein
VGLLFPTWLKPDRATRHIKRALRKLYAMKILFLCAETYGKKGMHDFLNKKLHQWQDASVTSKKK